MSRWLAPLVFALALGTALGAGAQDAPADDADNPFPEGPESDGLTYDAIDRATVRIFAVQHVEVDNVPGQRFARVIASPVAGHGSGIVVRRDGLVVTAKHVIEGA
ncbi:MAG: hypothetical protein GWO04_37350, partial [Actinobacteria bacterium]|nr:hypothetical protein [Actinomycetota bacterium]NIW31852.1 hypothetical protein [Actinomycetota bacterium]